MSYINPRQKPIYAHRNGETEAPTVEGTFWFKGTYYHGRRGGKTFAHDDSSMIQISSDEYGTNVDTFGSDEGRHLENFDGQWWGPLVPPWETNE